MDEDAFSTSAFSTDACEFYPAGFSQIQLDFLVTYMTANLPNQLKRWDGASWV